MPNARNATRANKGTTSGSAAKPNTTDSSAAKDGAGWPTTDLKPEDLPSFLSLRDSIHMFEWAALKLYMSGESVEARTARAKTVQEFVKDFKVNNGLGEGCPPGFHPVGDRCVADSNS